MQIKSLGAASWADRKYVVACLDTSGTIWIRYYQYGWDHWSKLGHPVDTTLDGPLAVFGDIDDIFIFARGADRRLYLYRASSGYWHQVNKTLG